MLANFLVWPIPATWISPADCPIHRHVHDLGGARGRAHLSALAGFRFRRLISRASASAPVRFRLAGACKSAGRLFRSLFSEPCKEISLSANQSETPRRPIRRLVASGSCESLKIAIRGPRAPPPRREDLKSTDRIERGSTRASILYFSISISEHPPAWCKFRGLERRSTGGSPTGGMIGDDVVDARADPLASRQDSRVTSRKLCNG